MIREKLHRWTRGPKSSRAALNRMAECIEWLMSLTVDTSTGLQWETTAGGPKLKFVPAPLLFYATVTVEAPGYGSVAAGGADRYGKGTAVLDREVYDTSGNCTRAAAGKSVTFYNPGKDATVAGRRVQLFEKSPGRYHEISELCA